jgi:hypothetical protein
MAQRRGFRLDAHDAAAFAICLLAAVALFLAGLLNEARAHDDAHWIQNEPRYKMTSGTAHCCSKDHCGMLQPGETVQRVSNGWLVVDTGQIFEDDQPYGLYESINTVIWRCKFPNNWVCLFYPKTGF